MSTFIVKCLPTRALDCNQNNFPWYLLREQRWGHPETLSLKSFNYVFGNGENERFKSTTRNILTFAPLSAVQPCLLSPDSACRCRADTTLNHIFLSSGSSGTTCNPQATSPPCPANQICRQTSSIFVGSCSPGKNSNSATTT